MQMLDEKLIDLTGATSTPQCFRMIDQSGNYSGCISPSFDIHVSRKVISKQSEIVLLSPGRAVVAIAIMESIATLL